MPHTIVFTRMPSHASSTASERVSALIAPFAAVYASMPGTPRIAAADEMLTIDAPSACARCGAAWRVHHTSCLSATVMIVSHASSVISANDRSPRPGPTRSVGAALLTSVVSPP